MNYLFMVWVGGCYYANNYFISQPLSQSPHGGVFGKIPKYYQDYADEIKRQNMYKEEQDRQERAEYFKNFFKGFFGFDPTGEEEPEKQNTEYPYSVFGLKRGASKDEVKKAYRKLVLQKHPDKGGSNEEFRILQEAWNHWRKITFGQ